MANDGQQIEQAWDHGAVMNSLAGYRRSDLGGLGCGIDTQCGCKGMGGLGDLLDPSTWGPADWLVAIVAGTVGWHMFNRSQRKKLIRKRIREFVK